MTKVAMIEFGSQKVRGSNPLSSTIQKSEAKTDTI